ncbi:MAG: AcrR family transcriptional regulator [Myxococcota bacterium]
MKVNATKRKILDAAQTLFAQHGYENTSLRQITAAAEVNLAAVNYHFGGKEPLLFELVNLTIKPINIERLQRLDSLPDDYGIEDVVRCFLEPAINALSNNHNMPCILGQAHREQNRSLQEHIAHEMRPIAMRFIDAIQRRLPHLAADQILARGEFMIGCLLHVLHSQTRLSQSMAPDQKRLGDIHFITEELIKFCTAGFTHE